MSPLPAHLPVLLPLPPSPLPSLSTSPFTAAPTVAACYRRRCLCLPAYCAQRAAACDYWAEGSSLALVDPACGIAEHRDVIVRAGRGRSAGCAIAVACNAERPGSAASRAAAEQDIVLTERFFRSPACSSHRPGCCAPRPWCVWQRGTCAGVVCRRPAPRHRRSASQPAPPAHLLSESAQTSQARPVPGLARAPEVTATVAASPNRTPSHSRVLAGTRGFLVPHPFRRGWPCEGMGGWILQSASGLWLVPGPSPVADWSGQWLQLGSSCGLNCAGAGAPG